MLKMTKIEPELISNITMHYFFEKRMRGGICYIANIHSKANNKYMRDYDSSEESNVIVYLDANDLYGWPMSQYLPYGGFEWLSPEKVKNFDVNSVSENSPIGYKLEVDLAYPDELYDFYDHYPLVAEKPKISDKMLSSYCSDIAKKYGIKVGGVKN